MVTEERHFPLDETSDERVRQAVQILTTEHFTLQSGRGNTISEANGRVNMFLASLSGVLIAVAFVGQIAHFGGAFRLFILVLVPSVLFVGAVTFARVIELTAEDMLYNFGINRIRHFYVELLPEARDYFVLSTHDDMAGGLLSMGVAQDRWQILFTIPCLVGVLNAILAGVLLALLSSWFLGWPVAGAAATALVGGLLAAWVQYRHMIRTMSAFASRMSPLFPSSGV
jgi:hypothetical protein